MRLLTLLLNGWNKGVEGKTIKKLKKGHRFIKHFMKQNPPVGGKKKSPQKTNSKKSR
jgi:hypothetical protein